MSEHSPSKLPPEDRLSREQEMWADAVGRVRRRARIALISWIAVLLATGYQIGGGAFVCEDIPTWLRVPMMIITVLALAGTSYSWGSLRTILTQMEHSVVIPRLWKEDDE